MICRDSTPASTELWKDGCAEVWGICGEKIGVGFKVSAVENGSSPSFLYPCSSSRVHDLLENFAPIAGLLERLEQGLAVVAFAVEGNRCFLVGKINLHIFGTGSGPECGLDPRRTVCRSRHARNGQVELAGAGSGVVTQLGFFALVGAIKVEDRIFECSGRGRVGTLLTLHRCDHHGMGSRQFFGVCFARLDPLGHEVLADCVLDIGGVRLLGVDPADGLVDRLGIGVAGHFADFSNPLGDRLLIFEHVFES